MSDIMPPGPVGPTFWEKLSKSKACRSFQSTTGFLRCLLDWIGRYEPVVIFALLVLVVSVWGFVSLADEVREGDTLGFDEWAVRALRRADDPAHPIGPEWLAEVGRDMTALGGIAFLTLLTIAVAGYLWLRKLYAAMAMVLVSTLSGLAASLLLKGFFSRPRPELVPHLSSVYTSSFPSGHAMLSATVFLTLGALLGRFVEMWRLKAYFLMIAVVLTVLVGVSRVYMGVHYPTDVLAGWAAGLAWALLCWLIARSMQQRGVVEANVDSKPDSTTPSSTTESHPAA
jgi:undecaprenyl-diphosphatase